MLHLLQLLSQTLLPRHPPNAGHTSNSSPRLEEVSFPIARNLDPRSREGFLSIETGRFQVDLGPD